MEVWKSEGIVGVMMIEAFMHESCSASTVHPSVTQSQRFS